MKKLLSCILTLVIICSLCACSNKSDSTAEDVSVQSDESTTAEAVSAEPAVNQTGDIDVDLTTLSSTMVYSEVYNMMINPQDYYGKIVKMSGNFSVYQDEKTGKNYYAAVIADATACCSQGLEFVPADDMKYPDDFPSVGTQITVVGEFQTYEENGYKYCNIINAKME